MRFEKSCGTIIYRFENHSPLFLVVRYSSYSHYWGLVKGHVMPLETEKDTARREIYEEVGFDSIAFVPGFRETIVYSPYQNCIKEVVFFLGLTTETTVRFVCNELDDALWLQAHEARKMMKHGNDRFVLHQANAFVCLHQEILDGG